MFSEVKPMFGADSAQPTGGALVTKMLGCIFGGAIGDALGMPVTGRSSAEIAEAGGVTDFLPSTGTTSMSIPLTALAEAEPGDLLEPGQWTTIHS